MDSKKRGRIFGLQPEILLLGIVSFLTDVSSEAIFSVFSIFFTVVLGASTALLGLVEGLSDFASSSLDYVSGSLSDRTGRRKDIAISGYALSTLAKGILVFASTVPIAAFFRVVERFGKSIRGPPRDAWIASIAEKSSRGYAFGVHKALDKAGAIVGPLLAYWFFTAYPQTLESFMLLFLLALVPALAATLLLLLVKEKRGKPMKRESIFAAYRTLDPGFKRYLMAAGLFSLAYFSFSFLLLKAYTVGFALTDIILLYALFNASFVVFSIPVGKLGDMMGRERIIALSYVMYAVMSVGFALASDKLVVALMFVLFGMFYAIDEGQTKAFISDMERKKRGTAIGLYNFATGLAYVPASIIAGLLWLIDPSYAFAFAALIAVLALVVFLYSRRK